jgi:hypothetical protein
LNKIELALIITKLNGIIQKRSEIEKDMRIYEEIMEIENITDLNDEEFLSLLGELGG